MESEATTPSGIELRIRQVPNAVRRAIRHPSWLVENSRGVARRRRAARHAFSLHDYAELFVDEERAVAEATHSPQGRYREVVRAFNDEVGPNHEPPKRPLFAGRPALIRIAYGIVRLCSSTTVVETGVAQGVTTAAILAAMDANHHGHLYSVDLPVLFADPDEFVGRLVPPDVSARWTLTLGPSRRVLGPLLRGLGVLDVFLHDADHSYEAQLEEYRAAWPHLRPGGILLSDDVESAAFPEFASEVGGRAMLIGDPSDRSAIGVLRKPD